MQSHSRWRADPVAALRVDQPAPGVLIDFNVAGETPARSPSCLSQYPTLAPHIKFSVQEAAGTAPDNPRHIETLQSPQGKLADIGKVSSIGDGDAISMNLVDVVALRAVLDASKFNAIHVEGANFSEEQAQNMHRKLAAAREKVNAIVVQLQSKPLKDLAARVRSALVGGLMSCATSSRRSPRSLASLLP